MNAFSLRVLDLSTPARKRRSTVAGLVSPLFELAKSIGAAVAIVIVVLIRGSG